MYFSGILLKSVVILKAKYKKVFWYLVIESYIDSTYPKPSKKKDREVFIRNKMYYWRVRNFKVVGDSIKIGGRGWNFEIFRRVLLLTPCLLASKRSNKQTCWLSPISGGPVPWIWQFSHFKKNHLRFKACVHLLQ